MPRGFNFVVTGIGSLPFTDPGEACKLIFQYMIEAPHWPQLPRVSPREGMIDQFLEGAPGVVEDGGRVYLRPLEPYEEWERFYQGYEEGDLDAFAISKERARGLYAFVEEMERREPSPFIKGQVTGPITLGLTLKDEEGAAAFFNPNLRDMLVKLAAMKARWQEATFKRLVPHAETIIFIDEPILSSYGSAFMNVSRDAVISALAEAIAPLQGLRGVHICGNTDWPMIMEAGFDIIDFDAYNYLDSFVLYGGEVRGFLEGGGAIGWGVVPTDEEALQKAEPADLAKKLTEGMEQLVKGGLAQELLSRASLITPSCGAGSLSEEGARTVYELTAAVAAILRRDFAS
jgi:methionine synthase II (cobalamin-independent)